MRPPHPNPQVIMTPGPVSHTVGVEFFAPPPAQRVQLWVNASIFDPNIKHIAFKIGLWGDVRSPSNQSSNSVPHARYSHVGIVHDKEPLRRASWGSMYRTGHGEGPYPTYQEGEGRAQAIRCNGPTVVARVERPHGEHPPPSSGPLQTKAAGINGSTGSLALRGIPRLYLGAALSPHGSPPSSWSSVPPRSCPWWTYSASCRRESLVKQEAAPHKDSVNLALVWRLFPLTQASEMCGRPPGSGGQRGAAPPKAWSRARLQRKIAEERVDASAGAQ